MQIFNGCIPSNINKIENIVSGVVSSLRSYHGEIDEDILFGLKVSLNEIIINAVKHGNKEDETKTVKVEAFLGTDDTVSITVQDEGRGYDLDSICRNLGTVCDIEKNSEDISVIPECGRGILLARGLCDSLSQDAQGRTVITMKLTK